MTDIDCMVNLVEHDCKPPSESVDAVDIGIGNTTLVENCDIDVGIGGVTLEEYRCTNTVLDGCMPTVDSIIDADDIYIDCGSNPWECGRDNDDFDAHNDCDDDVDIDLEWTPFTVNVGTIRCAVPS